VLLRIIKNVTKNWPNIMLQISFIVTVCEWQFGLQLQHCTHMKSHLMTVITLLQIFLSEFTNFKLYFTVLRAVVFVVICSGPLKQFANISLFSLMCISAYSHYAIKDGMDKMTSEFIFGMLLACRFIVRLQVQARENSVEQCVQHLENGETVADSIAEEVANKKTD